jgi:hypothetical protein
VAARSLLGYLLPVALSAVPLLSAEGPRTEGASAALSLDDVILLLQMKAPDAHILRIVERHGVAFLASNEAIGRIQAEGGGPALIGQLAVHVVLPKPDSPQPLRSVLATIPAQSAGSSPDGAGYCDIELNVDQSFDLLLRGAEVLDEVAAGAARPTGARVACSGPLPAAPVTATVQKTKGRGEVRFVDSPAAANAYQARIRIDDPAPGTDRYAFRIEWHRP